MLVAVVDDSLIDGTEHSEYVEEADAMENITLLNGSDDDVDYAGMIISDLLFVSEVSEKVLAARLRDAAVFLSIQSGKFTRPSKPTKRFGFKFRRTHDKDERPVRRGSRN
jgi:hypothetical protein